MKKLYELVDCDEELDILGVADDSRNISKGFLFVATKGFNVDHFDYIEDAISNGAVAIVADRKIDVSVPVVVVDNINDLYFDICSKFYDVHPSEFNFIGITGTDGKTTTATLVHNVLKHYAYIGTNGVEVNDKSYSTNNTTPCISEFYECLKFVKDNGCKHIVMEVSSEALLHNRLRNVKFDIVAFTNITEDHLNVHKTIENYRNCKAKLLELLKDKGIVIYNGDDENCRMICKRRHGGFGFEEHNHNVIRNVNEMSDCVKFELWSSKRKCYFITTKLRGKYNIYNVAMAFMICTGCGFSEKFVCRELAKVDFIKGRGERLDFGQDFEIILDYAHTFNGIRCLLESVQNYKKVIVVTGAAGGREKEKRHRIGKLILDKSTIAIFTMDDPRYESVDDIIDDMVSASSKDYIRIINREEAIHKAFELADKDSVVLVIGKGRDNYMAIEDRKEEYCDYNVIENYFNK